MPENRHDHGSFDRNLFHIASDVQKWLDEVPTTPAPGSRPEPPPGSQQNVPPVIPVLSQSHAALRRPKEKKQT